MSASEAQPAPALLIENLATTPAEMLALELKGWAEGTSSELGARSRHVDSSSACSEELTGEEPDNDPKSWSVRSGFTKVCYMPTTPIPRRCHVSDGCESIFELENWSGAPVSGFSR
jgi:hypothetical protein